MTHETLPINSLLLAEDPTSGYFANAFILHTLIVTAGHVARGNPSYQDPATDEAIQLLLNIVGSRDVALSAAKTIAKGFEKVALPTLNQHLTIVGYHGFQHTPFEIQVEVIQILPNGRVVVEWLGGTDAQVGMSGSPAITDQNEVVGVLVSGVEGTDGKQLYIESVVDFPFDNLTFE